MDNEYKLPPAIVAAIQSGRGELVYADKEPWDEETQREIRRLLADTIDDLQKETTWRIHLENVITEADRATRSHFTRITEAFLSRRQDL